MASFCQQLLIVISTLALAECQTMPPTNGAHKICRDPSAFVDGDAGVGGASCSSLVTMWLGDYVASKDSCQEKILFGDTMLARSYILHIVAPHCCADEKGACSDFVQSSASKICKDPMAFLPSNPGFDENTTCDVVGQIMPDYVPSATSCMEDIDLGGNHMQRLRVLNHVVSSCCADGAGACHDFEVHDCTDEQVNCCLKDGHCHYTNPEDGQPADEMMCNGVFGIWCGAGQNPAPNTSMPLIREGDVTITFYVFMDEKCNGTPVRTIPTAVKKVAGSYESRQCQYYVSADQSFSGYETLNCDGPGVITSTKYTDDGCTMRDDNAPDATLVLHDCEPIDGQPGFYRFTDWEGEVCQGSANPMPAPKTTPDPNPMPGPKCFPLSKDKIDSLKLAGWQPVKCA